MMQSAGGQIFKSGLCSEVGLLGANRPVVAVRCLGTAKPDVALERKKKKERSMQKKAVESTSFVQNMFRGLIETERTFPYPKVLNEEQAENLGMLVEPTEKFMTEVNDSAWNDANERVHPDTVQGLKELGAFGLQVGWQQEEQVRRAASAFLHAASSRQTILWGCGKIQQC